MKSDPKLDTIELERLPLEGGSPVRTMPLPLEFPGMHYLGEAKMEAVARVLKSRSLPPRVLAFVLSLD